MGRETWDVRLGTHQNLMSHVPSLKSEVSLHLEQRAIGFDFEFEFVADIHEILFG